LLTSNLSAERKKMPLAGVNIARAVALVEEKNVEKSYFD
jgi:hypothetical protein